MQLLISPGRYVQSKGVLNNLSSHLEEFGDKVLVITDPTVLEGLKEKLMLGLEEKEARVERFKGETSRQEIRRLEKIGQQMEANLIIGVGGGKAVDTAKAVADYLELEIVIIPTVASTDAPCSAVSVIYSEDGIFKEYLYLSSNPDLVILDTDIIVKAPVRYLVAGMGDALSTYFESQANSLAKRENVAGGRQTMTALKLARLCYETLLDYGLTAKKAVEVNSITPAVEKVIEANVLLSGLAFENGGIAAAHSIHNGFTNIKGLRDKMHGEKVAFCTIVQLILEDREPKIIDEVIDFCQALGLPTSLSDLGIADVSQEEILKVAKASCIGYESIYNLPFEVDPEMVKDAILTADRVGS